MSEIEVTERRVPAPPYQYHVRGDTQSPLEGDELLAWLADQICSESRVHPDRTMASSWITFQATLEFPHLWDRFKALEEATAAQASEIAKLKREREALREALFELMDAHGAMCGGDYELEDYSITPERCREMQSLAQGKALNTSAGEG